MTTSRRDVVKQAAWSVGVVSAAVAVPAQAASPGAFFANPSVSQLNATGSGDTGYSTGSQDVTLQLLDAAGNPLVGRPVVVQVGHCGRYVNGYWSLVNNTAPQVCRTDGAAAGGSFTTITDSQGNVNIPGVQWASGPTGPGGGGGYIQLVVQETSGSNASYSWFLGVTSNDTPGSPDNVTIGTPTVGSPSCSPSGSVFTCQQTYNFTVQRTGSPTGHLVSSVGKVDGGYASTGTSPSTVPLTAIAFDAAGNGSATFTSTWTQPTATTDPVLIPNLHLSWTPYTL